MPAQLISCEPGPTLRPKSIGASITPAGVSTYAVTHAVTPCSQVTRSTSLAAVAVGGEDARRGLQVGQRLGRVLLRGLDVAAVQPPARRARQRRADAAAGLDAVREVGRGRARRRPGPGVVHRQARPGADREHRAGGVQDRDLPRRRRREPGRDAHGPVREGRVDRRGPRVPDPQAGHRGDGQADGVHPRVDVGARAGRLPVVAVARDHRLLDRHARRVPVAAAGHRLHARRGVEVGDVEAPGQQPRDRVQRLRRGLRGVEVADQADGRRPRVEAVDVRAHHRPRHAARPALVDRAEAVDEELVADVRPAQRPGVVEVDRAHHRGGVGLGVVVRAGRVVHDGVAEARRVARRAGQRLVGAPLRARHDRGLGHAADVGQRRPRADGARRGRPRVDHDRAQGAHVAPRAHLHPRGPSDPQRLRGEGGGAALARPRRPRCAPAPPRRRTTPPAARRAHLEGRTARAAPGQAQGPEAARHGHGRRRRPAAGLERAVAGRGRQRQRAHAPPGRHGGRREQEQCGGERRRDEAEERHDREPGARPSNVGNAIGTSPQAPECVRSRTTMPPGRVLPAHRRALRRAGRRQPGPEHPPGRRHALARHRRAPARPTRRPCPFCEGHEERTPPEVLALGRAPGAAADGPGWTVRVVPNLFPAIAPEDGAHEVAAHGGEHRLRLAELADGVLEAIAEAWCRTCAGPRCGRAARPCSPA